MSTTCTKSGRAVKKPERFTYDVDLSEIVVGKEEKKYRDKEDHICESDSEADDDSTGSLHEFVADDEESIMYEEEEAAVDEQSTEITEEDESTEVTEVEDEDETETDSSAAMDTSETE
jgi:hypothetical protein